MLVVLQRLQMLVTQEAQQQQHLLEQLELLPMQVVLELQLTLLIRI
jgi:hypothetical protein